MGGALVVDLLVAVLIRLCLALMYVCRQVNQNVHGMQPRAPDIGRRRFDIGNHRCLEFRQGTTAIGRPNCRLDFMAALCKGGAHGLPHETIGACDKGFQHTFKGHPAVEIEDLSAFTRR